MRLLFNGSAVIEALTGIAVLLAPTFVIGLLLGEGLGPTGEAVSRVFGMGLLALGIAAWEIAGPDTNPAPRIPSPRIGVCTYNLGVAGLLTMLGATGHSDGILLWPAVGLHGLIGVAMLYVLLGSFRKTADS